MGLLDVYENMVGQAYEQEKVASVQSEEMQVIEKYASVADNLLAREFGNNYEEQDVIKLAQMLISNDIYQQEQIEKVAELHEAGVVMARAFKNELGR